MRPSTKVLFLWALLPFVLGTLASAQSPPTISKAFGAATMQLGTSTSLTFIVTNPNPTTELDGLRLSTTCRPG